MGYMEIMIIKLILENGEADGKKYKIETFPISLGRASGNDIHIPDDPMVSRIHCTIFTDANDENSLFIADLNSTNGTYLNDEILHGPTILSSSNIITLGSTRIKISY